MYGELSASEKVKIFVEIWGSKPAMVMGNSSNLLDCANAFILGLSWASQLESLDLEAFRDFLKSFPRTLSRHLTGSDEGVSWYGALLDLHNGDQSQAFQEFIHLLQEIAMREGFIAPDTREEMPASDS
jgi:hypothetical protein